MDGRVIYTRNGVYLGRLPLCALDEAYSEYITTGGSYSSDELKKKEMWPFLCISGSGCPLTAPNPFGRFSVLHTEANFGQHRFVFPVARFAAPRQESRRHRFFHTAKLLPSEILIMIAVFAADLMDTSL